MDENNQAPVSRVVAGIQLCIDNDIQIINMSFGTLVHSEILEEAVKKAEAAGILMVASVGNGGEATEDNVEYPAAFSEVIGVGSVDENMEISSFSSRGEQVELLAPGENVPVSTKWGFYSVDSGTSYAAPHVTALAALLWSQDGSKTSEEIRDILKKSANTIDSEGNNTYGIVDYTQAKEVAKDYTGVEDDEKSYQSQRELESFDVPEVVQANWSNEIDSTKEGTHAYLIGISSEVTSEKSLYSTPEVKALYYYASIPDNPNLKYTYEDNKSLANYKVLHAGAYSGNEYNRKKVNYVAVARCLYNCAYLLETDPTVTCDYLKDYCSRHYDSNMQPEKDIKQSRTDLRRIVQIICSNKLPVGTFDDSNTTNVTETISGKALMQLQLFGFALHAIEDAFSHQYVIKPSDATEILANKEFTYDAKAKSILNTGKCSMKDMEPLAGEKSREWHAEYADSLDYRSERYTLGARQATTMMLKLFRYANDDIRKFVPLIFVNTKFRSKDSNSRIPIYNLHGNTISAGYDLEDYTANFEVSRWYSLSFWK